MKTRREVLRSIAGASIAAPAASVQASLSTVDACRAEAGRLAELMQITCGGQWRVSVDRNLEFVLVQKVLA